MSTNTSFIAAPKLLEQVRGKIQLKHYSIHTEQSYTGWIKRYILFHGKRHPNEIGTEEALRGESVSCLRRISNSGRYR